MKMRIPLQRDADPKFNGVARTIAQGDPPKWLAVGLTHFSPGIGSDDDIDIDISTIIERMQGATDTLITWLPIFGSRRFGLTCPDEVLLVLGALPEVKKDLEPIQEVVESDESVVILYWAFDSRGGAPDVEAGTSHCCGPQRSSLSE